MGTRGRLLLLAAALTLAVPWPWQALQSAAGTDRLEAAGYEQRHTIARVETADLRKGDHLLGAVIESNQAAVVNKQTATRLFVSLLLGLPGAFLIGRYPRGSARE